jgi:hypothetical protein
MAKFGERLRRGLSAETDPPAPAEQTPAEQLADAEAALNALLGEQATAHATLIEHQQQRHAYLRDRGDVSRIVELDRADYQIKLRLEQIATQLPALQDAVQQARAAVHDEQWQSFRPSLVQAEVRLATSITELFAALVHARELHNAAHRRGFAGRLGEFLKVPPGGTADSVLSDYALREYVRSVEGRPWPAVPLLPDFGNIALEEATRWRTPPFTPRRVPVSEIEQISPIAPMRRVRLLHTVRASNLNIGHARLRAGEEMAFPARAAFVLTYSGVGVYTDAETAETTAAA